MSRKAITWAGAGLLIQSLALAQEPPAANPFARNEQAIGQGREIYDRTCTGCHGLNGAARSCDARARFELHRVGLRRNRMAAWHANAS